MGLIFGTITTTPKRVRTTEYPDTVDQLIVTMHPLGGLKSGRRFTFNAYAQDFLELHKNIDPETTLNDKLVLVSDALTGLLGFGIYNKEAFATIEAELGKEIPTREIGKSTMSFSDKPLYDALTKKYNLNTEEPNYFLMELADVAESPVNVWTLVPVKHTTEEVVSTEEEIVETTDEEVVDNDNLEEAIGESADIKMW